MTKKMGLGVTNYSQTHFYKLRWWETDLGAIMIILIGFVMYIITLIKIVNYVEHRKTKKWRKFLRHKLIEKIKNKEVLRSG